VSETAEAPSPDPMVTPELVLAFEKASEPEPTPSDTEAATAEEVEAPATTTEATPEEATAEATSESSPSADETPSEPAEEEVGLDWAVGDDDLHETLEGLKDHLTPEAVAVLKRRVANQRGIGKQTRELAQAKKDLERKAALGDEYLELLDSEEERLAFIEFKQGRETKPEEAVPTLTDEQRGAMTDAQYEEHILAQAAKQEDKKRADYVAAQKAQLKQDEETAEKLIHVVNTAHETEWPDMDDGDFDAACTLLNEEIRDYGLLPWDVLDSPETAVKRLGRHVKIVAEDKKRKALEEEVKKSDKLTREARLAQSASTSPGIRAAADIDTTTREGRMELARQQMPGANWKNLFGT